jgi:hypothetical protein
MSKQHQPQHRKPHPVVLQPSTLNRHPVLSGGAILTAVLLAPTSTASAMTAHHPAHEAGTATNGTAGTSPVGVNETQDSTTKHSAIKNSEIKNSEIKNSAPKSGAAEAATDRIETGIAKTIAVGARAAHPSPVARPLKTQSATPPHQRTTSPSASRAGSDPYASATLDSLEPTGLYGAQHYFTPTAGQWANAETILTVAKERGMAPYAAVIAIAVAMQESSLQNLTVAVDADSLGLFQQRPSMGWGTAAELTDPAYAANAFLSALPECAPDYLRTSLWRSAQAVQRSGFPTAYAQWESQAAHMVLSLAAGDATA